jgi:predicted HAD superfamily Cof-like phosphohydrolase
VSSRNKSETQQRVEAFMLLARQRVPNRPTEPTEAERIRVVRVMIEEALEMAKGFGVAVRMKPPTVPPPRTPMLVQVKDLVFAPTVRGFDEVEAVDGAVDLRVTATAALSACGIADEEPQQIVDEANLSKFGPGHSFRDDGKLIKPPDFTPPDIAGAIQRQRDACNEPMQLASQTKSVKSARSRKRKAASTRKSSQKNLHCY